MSEENFCQKTERQQSRIAELEAELANLKVHLTTDSMLQSSLNKAEARNKEIEAELSREKTAYKGCMEFKRQAQADWQKAEAELSREKEASKSIEEQLSHNINLLMSEAKKAEAKNKELEAEVKVQSHKLENGFKRVVDLKKRLSLLGNELKSQAAECAAMREALIEVCADMQADGEGGSCDHPCVNEALSHPPTKSERLALADRDVLKASETLTGPNEDMNALYSAAHRRAAILAER